MREGEPGVLGKILSCKEDLLPTVVMSLIACKELPKYGIGTLVDGCCVVANGLIHMKTNAILCNLAPSEDTLRRYLTVLSEIMNT
jgi:hypothetical protein